MAINFQQTDSATDACGGDAYRTRCADGEAAGSSENTTTVNGSAADQPLGVFTCIVDAGVTWAAGTWTIRLNVTTANMNLTWDGVEIHRRTSTCNPIGGGTIGTVSGLGLNIASTGVQTANVTGAAATPNAGDKIEILLLFDNGSMNSAQFGWTPDQLIDSPFTEAAAAGEGDGDSSGVATVAGVGSAIAAATGTAAGLGTVSGIGASTAAAVGASAGISAVSGVGTGLFDSVGAATGIATVAGVGASTAHAIGVSAGAATTAGIGETIAAAVAAAIGTAAVSGVGASIADAVGTATGEATVEATGDTAGAVEEGVAAAAGTATISGVGAAEFAAAGAAAGAATTVAIGEATVSATASAAGTASVAGVGASIFEAVGLSAGIASTAAVSELEGDLFLRPTSTDTAGGWLTNATGLDFPSVESVETSNTIISTDTSFNHTVTLPANIEAGDLLLVLFTGNGFGFSVAVGWPGGWTELFETQTISDQGVVAAAWREADGSEGSTITVTTDLEVTFAAHAYRISGASGAVPEVTQATFLGTAPDPAQLTPSWGSEKTLWVTFVGFTDDDGINSFPTNYGNPVTNFASIDMTLGSARRQLEAASDDPGVYSLASSEIGVVGLIAVSGISLSDLHTAIDEVTIDDADYIRSASDPVLDVCTVQLSGGSVDDSKDVRVKYRYKKEGVGTIDLRVRLLEGVTERASWTHAGIATDFVTASQTLSLAEAESVTNWSNVFLEFRADMP